jgi:hypothetical protein
MNLKLGKAILATGLIAGAFDGMAAVISFQIKGGKDPMVVFKFIASGVFGKEALSGGWPMAMTGLIFHLCIAIIWTMLFFFAYERFKINTLNWMLSGVLYGMVVWVGMNKIVVPLSNTPPLQQSAAGMITGAIVLMVCIGLPVSYGAKKFFINT